MGEKIERWAAVVAVVLALVGATFYLGEELGGVKAEVADLRGSMEALFADIRAELRDQRRDVADVRERVSALEAGS